MSKLIDKTYSFYSKDLNTEKYYLLYDKALKLRDFKNELSVKVCQNFLNYLDKTKYDFIKLFRTTIKGCNNQDISHAISDVFVAYDNKREAFERALDIKIQDGYSKTYYKKTHKKHNLGDVKTFKIKKKSTNITKVTAYLTRYYNDYFINYLRTNISKDPKIKQFRELVLTYVDKYGDKLLNLVKNKQKMLMDSICEFPIEFKSLTFSSCTEQKQNIINKNPNTHSNYNAYITLPGQQTQVGKIHIPTKHSKKHHGLLKHYYKKPNKKGQIQISYQIIFLKKNSIRITLTRKKKDDKVVGKEKCYGIDTNVKHNLFCDKFNDTIDYDRKLFNDYILFLQKMDKKLTKVNKYNKENGIKERAKLSVRDEKTKQKWIIRIKDMLKRKSNLLVKQAIEKGFDHIVMEDLKQMAKSFLKSEEFLGFKYSRLIRLLNLTDLKNIVTSIANKKGLQVTFAQPHYTSQGCRECGYISRDNRTTQEIFKCAECEHTSPSDAYSAGNIEERMSVDVLRNSLFNKKDGLFIPKKLSKDSIKIILTDYYETRANSKKAIDYEKVDYNLSIFI